MTGQRSGAFNSPAATEHKVRQVIPFFALSFDIPDKDGNILYPAGYTFNPLEYLRLPSRLIIVAENQLDWGIAEADIGDMVIMAGGNAFKGHALSWSSGLQARTAGQGTTGPEGCAVDHHPRKAYHFIVEEIPSQG